MLASIPLLAFTLGAALFAVQHARRHRNSTGPAVAPATSISTGRRVPGLTRLGRVGDARQPDPARALISIASMDDPGTALVVTSFDGGTVAVAASDVVMARGWSRGHLVVAFGETRREYGPSWALGPALAGWELHVVTASGATLRCYGAPGSAVDDELVRLHERIQLAVLPQAS